MPRANYDLPEEPLARVVELSHAKSKKEAIIIALNEYLKKKKIERLIAKEGKILLKWTGAGLKKYRD